MTDLENAFRLVLEQPASESARLAYASALDAIHDPLGEFIRLECQLACSNNHDDAVLPLWDRRLALLEAHGRAWFAPLSEMGELKRTAWGGEIDRTDRGLVSGTQLELDTYLAHGSELFGRYPIRSLHLYRVHGRMGELLASPWIDRIESLSLAEDNSWGGGDLTDEDVEELAASDRPRKLRRLILARNERIGPRSVEAILGARWCDQLEALDFGWTSVGDEGASLLAAADRLGNLRRLKLSNCGLGPAGARALAESTILASLGLTHLDFSLNYHNLNVSLYHRGIDQEDNIRLLLSPILARTREVRLTASLDPGLVDALIRSDFLGSMKQLRIDFGSIDTGSLRRLANWPGMARLDSLSFTLSALDDDHLEVLANSPRLADLKSLGLSETEVTDKGVERLCRSPTLRGLVDLDIDRNHLTERSVHAIVAAPWFPRLRALSLHASYTLGDAGAMALASYQGPTQLRTLELSMAGIGDAGAQALAEAPYVSQLWLLWLLGNENLSKATGHLLRERLGDRVVTDWTQGREDWRDQSIHDE